MPAKRKAASMEEPGSGMSDFEKARAVIIARNLARLEQLGIPSAVAQLQKVVETEGSKKAPQKASKKKVQQQPASEDTASQPVRRSARNKTGSEQPVDKQHDVSEADKELAVFIIDGECPKCGKIVTKGHRQHLARCSGPYVPEDPSLAELLEREVKKLRTDEKKLKELDLGGLIELTDEHAVFMVIGSTGNHYKVTLSNDARKCQCVDHRTRKHDCKHIRLLLKTLDIEGRPLEWHHAVDALVAKHAESLALPAAAKSGSDKKAAPSADAAAALKFL